MTERMGIKSISGHDYIFTGEADSLGELLESAIRAQVDLTFADLTDADLSGANLSGANLNGANLYGARK